MRKSYIETNYQKFDEIPFDFVRCRMSVVVEEIGKQHILICKGAVEEILKVCTQLKVNDKVLPIDESVHTKVADLQPTFRTSFCSTNADIKSFYKVYIKTLKVLSN